MWVFVKCILVMLVATFEWYLRVVRDTRLYAHIHIHVFMVAQGGSSE